LAIRDHMRAELTIAALTMAIQRSAGAGLIHHSDRGSHSRRRLPHILQAAAIIHR